MEYTWLLPTLIPPPRDCYNINLTGRWVCMGQRGDCLPKLKFFLNDNRNPGNLLEIPTNYLFLSPVCTQSSSCTPSNVLMSLFVQYQISWRSMQLSPWSFAHLISSSWVFWNSRVAFFPFHPKCVSLCNLPRLALEGLSIQVSKYGVVNWK